MTDTTTDPTTLTGSWVLDTDETVIKFETKMMWVISVKGTFKAVEGHGNVDADGTVTGSLYVDMASVDTKIAKRDRHLRSPDFFDVEKYPTMTFTVTAGHATTNGSVELAGTLTIHGQTRPLTLVADLRATGSSLTLTSETEIDRSDWGISLSKGPGKGPSMKNRITIAAHFNKV